MVAAIISVYVPASWLSVLNSRRNLSAVVREAVEAWIRAGAPREYIYRTLALTDYVRIHIAATRQLKSMLRQFGRPGQVVRAALAYYYNLEVPCNVFTDTILKRFNLDPPTDHEVFMLGNARIFYRPGCEEAVVKLLRYLLRDVYYQWREASRQWRCARIRRLNIGEYYKAWGLGRAEAMVVAKLFYEAYEAARRIVICAPKGLRLIEL